MKKNLIIFILSFLLFFPTTIRAEKPIIISGKAAIYNNNIKSAEVKAKKIAIARGIFKVLSTQIPIQYMNTKYKLLKKEFGEKGEDYLKTIESLELRQRGTTLSVKYKVTWDTQKIFRKLGELEIIPLGAIPPVIYLKYNLPPTLSTDVPIEQIKNFFNSKLKQYHFPVTSKTINADYKIFFTIKVTDNILSNKILKITNLLFKFSLYTKNNKLLYNNDVTHVSTLINTKYLLKELNSNFITGIKKLKLNWHKRNKKLKKLKVIFKDKNKILYTKLYVTVLKNSDKISSIKMVKLYSKKGLFYIIYYKPVYKKELIVEELSKIIKKIGLKLKSNGGFIEISKE